MRVPEALTLLDKFLAPVKATDFLGLLSVGHWRRLQGIKSAERLMMLGANPIATLKSAYALATDLTYHSANASEMAPSLSRIDSEDAFAELINTFHERRYSVRFPGLRSYSSKLEETCRALEVLLHKPVTASAFWSQGGMQAPVHTDDHDLLVVQVKGRKRWMISDAPASLENTWKSIPGEPITLGEHSTFEVVEGDIVYMPRGTIHSVVGIEESIHVSIGFTPLTLREAMIALIDYLSDLDRHWRMTVTPFMAHHLMTGGLDGLPDALQQAARALGEEVNTNGILLAALQRRSSRAVASLQTNSQTFTAQLSLDSVMRQHSSAIWHLSANAKTIDVAYPGGHAYIHRGAESGVIFIVNTPEFTVRDIPGSFDDAVRLSLAERFQEMGIIEQVYA